MRKTPTCGLDERVAEQQLTLETKGKEPVGWDGVGGWQWKDLLNGPIHFFHSADAPGARPHAGTTTRNHTRYSSLQS